MNFLSMLGWGVNSQIGNVPFAHNFGWEHWLERCMYSIYSSSPSSICNVTFYMLLLLLSCLFSLATTLCLSVLTSTGCIAMLALCYWCVHALICKIFIEKIDRGILCGVPCVGCPRAALAVQRPCFHPRCLMLTACRSPPLFRWTTPSEPLIRSDRTMPWAGILFMYRLVWFPDPSLKPRTDTRGVWAIDLLRRNFIQSE